MASKRRVPAAVREWYASLGRSKSKAKAEAARRNGRKGGRPPKRSK